MMTKWRWVKGFKGFYQVSTSGKVRSVDRIIERGEGIKQPMKGKVLQAKPGPKTGYCMVSLSKPGQKVSYRYVHRLVAEAFIPNPSNLPEVNHKDLNKSNNRSWNLEWATSAGNKKHAAANGVKFNPNPKRGEEAGPAVQTWESVREMRRMYTTGNYTQKELAKIFNMTSANAYFILRNKTWVENQTGLVTPTVTKEGK